MSVAGIRIRISWTWLIFAVVITVLFLPTVRIVLPAASTPSPVAIAFGFALVLLFIVVIHEVAHAVAARSFGWQVHSILVNLWGGVTSYSTDNSGATLTPGRSLTVALAGPAANIVGALAGIGLSYLWAPGPAASLLLVYWIWANWLIAGFNLLPGAPLDGGRIVASTVWKATGDQDRGQMAAGWAGRVIVVVLVLGVLIVPILRGQTPDIMMLAIVALIGMYLWQAASQTIHQAQYRLIARRIRPEMIMHAAIAVPVRSTVADLMERLQHAQASHVEGHTLGVIVSEARDTHPTPLGLIDAQAVAAVNPDDAHRVSVIAVATEVSPSASVPLWSNGLDIIRATESHHGSPVIVYDQAGAVAGVIYHSDVLQLLSSSTLLRQ